jgi:hypothetical protein
MVRAKILSERGLAFHRVEPVPQDFEPVDASPVDAPTKPKQSQTQCSVSDWMDQATAIREPALISSESTRDPGLLPQRLQKLHPAKAEATRSAADTLPADKLLSRAQSVLQR